MVCAALLSSASLTFAQEADSQEWLKALTSRITVSGFIQGGYTATHLNGQNTNSWDIKRAILIARARVTDRWSFFVMHDMSSVLQEFYTDYRLTNDEGSSAAQTFACVSVSSRPRFLSRTLLPHRCSS